MIHLDSLRSIAAECPGNHHHLPYGRKQQADGTFQYATSEEAVYPRSLCKVIATVVAEHCRLPPPHNITQEHQAAAVAASAARQSRGRKMPPVLGEFLKVVQEELPAPPKVNDKRKLLKATKSAPVGSKMLSMKVLKGDVREDSIQGPVLCMFGIYRSKTEFLQAASSVQHPFNAILPLSDHCKSTLFKTMTRGPSFRLDTLRTWLDKAKELEEEERARRRRMPGTSRLFFWESVWRCWNSSQQKLIGLMQAFSNSCRAGLTLLGISSHQASSRVSLGPPRAA